MGIKMKSLLLAGTLTMLGLLAACGGGAASNTVSNPALSSIQVSGATTSLNSGASQQMTATGVYSNNSTQNLTSTATWASSDANVATVAAGGMVTAKAHGTCTITATDHGVIGSINLTVNTSLVSIAVTAATLSIAPATTEQFTATGTYSDGSTQNITGSVTWGSSNTAVSSISSAAPTKGLARGISPGQSVISATSGSIVGSATLTVTSATVTAIAVSPQNANIPLGIAQQFTALGTFSDGTTQDITNVVIWKSSASGIASITVSGLATALNVGTTTISAAFGSSTGSAPLTVNAANLSSLSITPFNASIAQGTSLQLTATGTFNDGGTRNLTNQVIWTSSDVTVATIAPASGIASGQSRSGSGTSVTIITATLGSVTATVNLTVTSAVISSISVAPSATTVPIGGQAGFQATGLFDDSSTQDITANCQWSSSNPSVATVGSGGGSILSATGVAAGTANINAAFGGITGSATLTVNSATLVSISVSPANAILAPASTLNYTAIATFSDGSKRSINGNSTWSSSSTNVATVNNSGVVTGQSAGTATITVQSGSVSATASLVVEGAQLSSIQVSPISASIPESINVGFSATGLFANNDTLDLTRVATWTSSSASVATVSNANGSKGVVSGLTPGNTTVSALFSGKVGTASITVTTASLISISVTPPSASISVGSTQQYAATGTFSDGSVLNITGQVTWSSSDVSVAIINRNGLLSSVAAGTATVTASLNNVSGTAIVSVH
jgi:uncharacterized protein YjdB